MSLFLLGLKTEDPVASENWGTISIGKKSGWFWQFKAVETGRVEKLGVKLSGEQTAVGLYLALYADSGEVGAKAKPILGVPLTQAHLAEKPGEGVFEFEVPHTNVTENHLYWLCIYNPSEAPTGQSIRVPYAGPASKAKGASDKGSGTTSNTPEGVASIATPNNERGPATVWAEGSELPHVNAVISGGGLILQEHERGRFNTSPSPVTGSGLVTGKAKAPAKTKGLVTGSGNTEKQGFRTALTSGSVTGGSEEIYNESSSAGIVNIKYGPGPKEILDVYLGPGERNPTTLMVHGGGWATNSKKVTSSQSAGIAKYGGTAINLEYPLDTESEPAFPKQVEAIKRALHYTIEHASSWHVDVNRINILGGSAGGQLVAQVALEVNEEAKEQLIKKCVCLSGVFDFVQQVKEFEEGTYWKPGVEGEEPPWPPKTNGNELYEKHVQWALGCTLKTAGLYGPACPTMLPTQEKWSPAYLPMNFAPKFMLFEGEGELMKPNQIEHFVTAAAAYGAEVKWKIGPFGGHAFSYWQNVNKEILPFVAGKEAGSRVTGSGNITQLGFYQKKFKPPTMGVIKKYTSGATILNRKTAGEIEPKKSVAEIYG